MKNKTKIFHNGRQINGRFDSFKAKVRRFFRMIVRWSLITGGAYAIFMAGAFFYSTSTVTATTEVQTVVPQSPVLDRIADCESGNGKKGSATQYAKNGQVIMHANTNGTIDIGKYMVNDTYWGAKAHELGFDLTTTDGNKAMAEWIYANKGTGDWSSSAKCWNR